MMLQTLGVSAGKLSDSEQKKLNTNVNELKGLRNRISHDYGSLDYDLVWEITKNDLPELLKQIEENILKLSHSTKQQPK